jgi:hypothetical protein
MRTLVIPTRIPFKLCETSFLNFISAPFSGIQNRAGASDGDVVVLSYFASVFSMNAVRKRNVNDQIISLAAESLDRPSAQD